MMPEKSNEVGRTHTWNIGVFKIGFVSGDYIFKRVLIKRGLFQKHIQNNICVDKDFHTRCFDSLSSRISSRLMSPKPAAAPKRRSARGVFLTVASLGFSEGMAAAMSCFIALAGVKAIIVLPAGTSRGTSRVIRRSAGMSMVCVMVMFLV